MNSLKAALSTKESNSKNKQDPDSSLLRGVNKSKNVSLWALDVDPEEQATEESLQTDNLLRSLNDKLKTAFQRDSAAVTEITFERIIEEFQDEAGGNKSELAYLHVIEDKLGDIMDFAKGDFKKFTELFGTMLTGKVTRLRNREKKSDLSNFDKIAGGNFAKKKKTEDTPYLTVEEEPYTKEIRKSRDKTGKPSKSPMKDDSSENKLKRLFSKDKKPVKEREKERGSIVKGEEDVQKTYMLEGREDSVNISAVLSTSVGVRARRRKQSNEFKEKKPKAHKGEAGEDQKDEKEEAFLFFRPKKGRR